MSYRIGLTQHYPDCTLQLPQTIPSFAGGERKRIRTNGPVAKTLAQAVVKGVFWFDNGLMMSNTRF